MKFTEDMVKSYADKLLIGLTCEETKMVLDEFEIIDCNIDLINKIDNIENVVPMSYALDDFTFTLREDVVVESTPIEDLLKNCDEYNGREIEVPKVVTNDVHE